MCYKIPNLRHLVGYIYIHIHHVCCIATLPFICLSMHRPISIVDTIRGKTEHPI